MPRRFFVERFSEGRATVTGEAAHHLGHVLRAEPGQVYELSDGHSAFVARVESVERDAIHFTLGEPAALRRTSQLHVTLLLSIVKYNPLEWALEKATELGVDVIVPLAAARSEKGLLAAAPKRAARWHRILEESAKQSRRLQPPALEELSRPVDAFRAAANSLRILLSERPDAPSLREVLETAAPQRRSGTAGIANKIDAATEIAVATDIKDDAPLRITLAIGPEGGWTPDEFASATMAGFHEAGLGEQILRAETAVVAGLAVLRFYWDRDR